MTAPLPAGPYQTILADPAWGFRTFGGADVTPHRTKDDHYETMTHAELLALPVADIAGKDCALFLWVIDSHLKMALEVGEAWGFTYKTRAFTWLKMTADFSKPRIGMGYWTRKESELCLLFTRGKPPRLEKSVREVIIAPKREHSRKPDEQYELIERLVGGPRLEMFARQRQPGWDAWGNETDKFVGDPLMELIG